jgi:hypothetical protein
MIRLTDLDPNRPERPRAMAIDRSRRLIVAISGRRFDSLYRLD